MKEKLAANRDAVLAEIAAACQRAGRAVDSVRLIAVTKYAQLEWVRGLVELGQTELGENRPQQLIERSGQVGRARWHLIGHLQRNKVRAVLPHAACIHSIDSLKLLARIGEIAGELALQPRVLIEVNVSGEQSKDGFDPAVLRREWPEILAVSNVAVSGLMTMAPLADDAELARPCFRMLRELRDELQAIAGDRCRLDELSMGMSGDFAVAIEEGTTMVRVGTRLFEGLDDSE
jgi:pyridoxal phosphate enzyme (YggS family)